MLISHAYEFTYRGKPATLRILRNDGHAWGRIIEANGTNWDVSPDGDIYDMTDTDALELLAELVGNHPEMVSEAAGWRMKP